MQTVFTNSRSMLVDWNAVSGADQYHCQVASDPDFVTLIDDDDTLTNSEFSFTDGGTDNTKRWWRWRYSIDGGTNWSLWQDVGMYWLKTSATDDVDVEPNKWKLFIDTDLEDQYIFETFPIFEITPDLIPRGKMRNRKGELLSDYITSKDLITAKFDNEKFIQREQYREILRFYTEHKTFFLAINLHNGVDEVPHVWKVQLVEAPEFKQATMTRNDLFEGEVKFEEV